MELKNTINMMTSEDYQERFKAEYYQLSIRKNKLQAMIKRYEHKELTFIPKCSIELLTAQVKAMDTYMLILKERARLENIEL